MKFIVVVRIALIAYFTIISFYSLQAQDSKWKRVHTVPKTQKEVKITPDVFHLYDLDIASFRSDLKTIPHEDLAQTVRSKDRTILLPSPSGESKEFVIAAYDLMEPELAKKWDYLSNWKGYMLEDPTVKIRLDWTARGFHAMVFDHGNLWYIDPYHWEADSLYQVYTKKDYPRPIDEFVCHVKHDSGRKDNIIQLHPSQRSVQNGDCQLRQYRVAIAVTGEYTTYHGGTLAGAASAINTTLSRVNGVYESELGIQLILVSNNNSIIYLDGNTDPYTNENGGTMLYENQTNLDNVIGTNNYDIGHVFSTGGGGIAQLYSPCNAGSKARGVTGRAEPVGDPFDIDYVAHEMGHQFGANHTQNNSCNSVANTRMEPGSASTIMGYAGICAPNVQNNSDAYYHAVNLQEIANYMELGDGNTCATIIASGSNPSVDAGVDRTIPKSTPFVLTASGTGDTYTWEQFDNEVGAMPPQSTNAQGPMFRSFEPSTSPSRYFPAKSAVLTGTSPEWEVLPSVSRTMEFRATARNNNGSFGCNNFDDVTITVDGNSGPFTVQVPNTAVTWAAGSSQQIKWDVAKTNVAPINTSEVEILLSTDGGSTFPYSLATAPNVGAATVTVPQNTSTSAARIMVKPTDNVYYDISDTDFIISQPSPLTWLSFDLVSSPGKVQLEWSTTGEVNTSHFIIEKSMDGRSYEDIGRVISANKSGVQRYGFLDTDLFEGKYYYRIKQVDLDGKYDYSSIQLSIQNSEGREVAVVPNPTRGTFRIRNMKASSISKIRIYNILGERMPFELTSGNETIVVDMENHVPKGHYVLTLLTKNGKIVTERFIKE